MKLIKQIGIYNPNINYKKREAVRAVISDGKGNIMLIHAGKYNYYKIPGGGIEPGEKKEEALEREIAEEAGIQAKILGELGETLELKNDFSTIQTSYAYFGVLQSDLGKTNYTDKEKEEEFSASWVELNKAIELLKICNEENYFGDSEHEKVARYMVARDLAILEEYKKIIK